MIDCGSINPDKTTTSNPTTTSTQQQQPFNCGTNNMMMCGSTINPDKTTTSNPTTTSTQQQQQPDSNNCNTKLHDEAVAALLTLTKQQHQIRQINLLQQLRILLQILAEDQPINWLIPLPLIIKPILQHPL